MARRLDALPSRNNGRAIYPWGEWLDGSIWELTQGEDFTCALQGFRNMVHQAAHRRNLTAHIRMTGDKTIAIWTETP